MLTARYPYLFDADQARAEATARDLRGRDRVAASGTFGGGGASIRQRVADLGAAGLYAGLATGPVRSLAVIRGSLAWADPWDDLAFVIQELGAVPLARAGGHDALLAAARRGEVVLCFALTEPEAGSDVRALATTATPDGERYRLTGEKCFISNAPDADHAVVFARFSDGPGVGCFLVDGPPAVPQGVAEHSLGRLVLDGTPARLVSRDGLKLALGTLERCRPTVGLAAWGMAQRGFEAAVAYTSHRRQFGAPLAALPVVQSQIAQMAIELDTAVLPALHACWRRDTAPPTERTGYDSAVGKVAATEMAGRVLDRCVQLHGGVGVLDDHLVQRLWRGLRPLRIYEGATDVLHTLIAAAWLPELAR